MKTIRAWVLASLCILLFTACSTVTVEPILSEDYGQLGLTEQQFDSLLSLAQVDEYPLYTMYYSAPYETVSVEARWQYTDILASNSDWGCSLFATFSDAENMLYGRNFDWEYSPALLLFTDPPNGFASVSMVDIKYLGFDHENAKEILSLPLADRVSLLEAPYLPFDGLNETGLAVGMAAVPAGNMQLDPDKETINSLLVIREILDHASNVDQAISIIGSYNIDYGSGPPLHYLIADATGRSALIEFYQGEMHVIYNQTDWQQATNFLLSSAGASPQGLCWRYDMIHAELSQNSSMLTAIDAINLLSDVSQDLTQWSIVYGMSTGDIHVIMGKQYDNVHILHLNLLSE